MDKKVYAALTSVLQYLETEQVELQGKMVGLCVPVLRTYLAQQQGSAVVKTHWLFEDGLQFPHQFPLGQLLVTEGATALARQANYSLITLLCRHASGDTGECAASAPARDYSNGWPVFSAYTVQGEARLWIITEGDRRATLLLVPHEFAALYTAGEINLQPATGYCNGSDEE